MKKNNYQPASITQQKGVIMLITLIALMLVMLSALALMRSFDVSLSMSGNLAFKRDLVNQGERGMAQAIALFNDGGALSDAATRNNDVSALNYYASMQATNSRGMPTVLINKGINDANINDTTANVKVVYVIDRLCTTAGEAFSSDKCTGFRQTSTQGGSSNLAGKKAGQIFQAVYRISVRANGPRNTQVYLQTTITR